MSGLAGDDYNETTEATRGAAAAPLAPLDFLSVAGPLYDSAAPIMGELPKGAKGMNLQSDISPDHKLAAPLMSLGQMSTQSQTPTMIARDVGFTGAAFAFPVAQRDGREWRAKLAPRDQKQRDLFFFAPTNLAFDADKIRLHELVSRVYEFSDREFAVEIKATNATEGTFDLACFVKTAMVMVRVTIWHDVERGCLDRSDVKHFNGLRPGEEDMSRFVVEMTLVEGCGITFCDIFRRFKKVLDPKGLLSDRDALSATASMTSNVSGAGVAANALVSEEVAMDGEQLMEFGGEFAFPTSEEWESVLADCEVLYNDRSQNDAKNISAAVESLASIACTYAAKDLEYLAQCCADRKIGFCHDCYCDDDCDLKSAGCLHAGDRHAAGKHVLSQLWAMAVLVKHLAKHQGNLEHLKALVPELDGALRRLLADSYGGAAGADGICCWVTVVHALSEGLCLVLAGCRDYNLVLDEQCKGAFPSSDANVDAFFKQADSEKLAATRTCAAAGHLRQAYACWTELRGAA